ncbi:TPA: type II toxin-antitoxin system HipA family toxin [Legionella pneumophila]|uniref:Type II toxin-antitoxin system HipA family toxin n=2 Tax=Legionella pneumophila TaxID=446 RepID=A0A2S6EY72_LEGPN|nr:type II toxin-antitoxin system HipA family toxin [Legionella pneumophila]RYB33862.1 type II toxin-antitoxin system HipA family toxin [Legionella pneumophila]RYW22927.1 type II toxin-antitoxin system HipA family toxin [Legionella pneumophila]TIG99431.1 type II toxin-antitoxin system HipA family toxin [Legionella pneumophila]HAT6811362.1 type II toxin-antitoxin system HipA family toxin [Legionella pneumophila]
MVRMKMTGDKPVLDVYLGERQIANITLIEDQLYWSYHDSWQQTGYAISPHLPLHEIIPPLNVQRFLRNLLPEGNPLEVLVNIFHLSKYNTFGLIQALGLDTPGSLVILPSNQATPDHANFRLITDEELEERLNHRDPYDLIVWDGKPRLSVAGVQDKINVVLNKEGQLGFGEGSLCSTHILKFETQKLSYLVLNEFLSMWLAKRCGLNVADAQMKRFGQHPALLVERFDRKWVTTNVVRRHLIDGCQALNLPPEYKYEQNFGNNRDVAHIRDGVSLPKLFDFANQCINPAKTKQQILDWVLFNVLIFNCDAHGKNISFFVGVNGISLAPFYDLVNIKMYPEFEHALAMALGDEFDGDNINAYQLADFADTCQLPRSLVVKHLKYLIGKLTTALQEETQLNLIDNEEDYLKKYQEIVMKRCEHLLKQSGQITSIKL